MAAAREMNYSLIFRADVSALKPAANDAREAIGAIGTAARQASGALDTQTKALSRTVDASRAAANAARALSENSNSGRDRAADIAAYGKALDDSRAKIVPLFAAERNRAAALAEINEALKTGAIRHDEAAAAIARTNAAYEAQAARIRQADAALLNYARNQKAAAEAIVARQAVVPDRAADIAAYGKALDDTRARWSPLFAAARDYEAELAGIRQSVRTGAIDQGEAEAAITRTTAAYEAQTAAIRRADSSIETLARNRKRAAEAVVAGQTIAPDRAADIAAYGKALDDGRARWDPLYAAVRKYRDSVKEIRDLEKSGAFGVGADAARRATDAIRRERELLRGVVTQERTRRNGPSSGGQLEPWQKQNLTYQVYDIGTSLASGMNPGVVLAQQGPQIAQIYGGVAPTLKAIGQALTPVRLGVGAVTAALVVGASAWSGYLSSTKALETANAGLGRRLGVTAEELEAQARAGAAAGAVSVKAAREMEVAFLRTGKVGARHYADLIGMAKDFGTTIGTDAAGGAAKLAELLADPARGAQTLSRELGLLDGVTARYVQRLAASGQAEEARAVLIEALPDKLASAADATTALGRAWDWVGRNASDAMDAIGLTIDKILTSKPPAPGEKVSDARKELDELLYESVTTGGGRNRRTVRVRRADADQVEAEADALPDDAWMPNGARQRATPSRVVRVRRAKEALAAANADQQAEAAATEEARRKAVADAAITRGHDVASGSAGSERARRMRGLRDDIGALQGALDAGAAGSERSEITSALEAKRRALAALEQQQARNVELDRLDVAIQNERVPAIRAELVARREALRIDGKEIDNATAAAEKAAARAKAYAEADGQMTLSARTRRESTADQIAALEAEIATLGRSAGAVAELEAVTRALAAARREAKGGIVSPDEEARIRADAAAVGQATDRASAARLIDDVRFERAQLARPEGERDIAARLRSARIDPTSVEGQQAAAEMRALDALKKQREALEGIKGEAKDYLAIVRESTGAWDAGEKILDRFLEKLQGRVEDYLLNAALGIPQPKMTLAGFAGFKVSGATDGGGAPAAGPPLALAPAANDNRVPAGAVVTTGLGALASAYRGRSGGLEGLDPGFAGQLDAFVAANPGVTVNSAYRTYEQQKALFDAAVAQYGSEALARKHVAPPGRSYHNRGLAADLGYASPDALARAQASAPEYGLAFPVRGENWHIEPAGARRGAAGAAAAVEKLATAADTAATKTDSLGAGMDGLGQSVGGLFSQLGAGLDRLLSGALGGGGSGGGLWGWLGSLFGGSGTGAGTGAPASGTPITLPGIGTGTGGVYSVGGYTGPGPVHKPAGIVHAGEIVWSQADIRRVGGVSAAEGIRTGARGYASGGVVQADRVPLPARVSVPVDRIQPPGWSGSIPTGDRQGTAPAAVAVQIHNYSGQPADTEDVTDAQGNRSINMTIGEKIGGAIRQRGNPARRSLMSDFNLRPRGTVR